jgi:hypothetical protein
VRRRLPITILLLSLVSLLHAQSWDEVRRLQPGQKVRVRDNSGVQHGGVLSAVTAESITVKTSKSEVSTERARVKRVQVSSPARRGRNIAIGAGVGIAIGAVTDQTLGTYLRNETGESSGARAATYLLPAALFGAIGAALSPYRTVYKVK